jgi:RNA polymerase sigma-70 factor (ECF subfamily)
MIASPKPPQALSLDRTAPPPRHDTRLIRAITLGDERALGELYDRYAPMLLAHVMRLLDDQADAESVLLETFNQAWLSATRFDPSRGAVAAWLLSMGRSRALDLLRARGRRTKLMPQSLDSTGAAATQIPDVDCDPARGAEHRERQAAVAAALRELPESQRAAIELAFFEGLSHGEIAERLAQPLGTIKTRIRLGMHKLRDALRVHGEEFAT